MERMHSLTETYYRETAAVLLVYDIHNALSLRRLPNWKADLKYHSKSARVFLVGNKNDLEPAKYDDRHTTVEHVNRVMVPNSDDIVRVFEVSAKEDKNVEKMFHHVAQEMWAKHLEDKTSTGNRSEQGSFKEKDGAGGGGGGGGIGGGNPGLNTITELREPQKHKVKCCP